MCWTFNSIPLCIVGCWANCSWFNYVANQKQVRMVSFVHALALDESRIIRLINPPPNIFHHCQRSSMSGDDLMTPLLAMKLVLYLRSTKRVSGFLRLLKGPNYCQTVAKTDQRIVKFQVALQVQARSEQSAILPQSLKHWSLRTEIVRPRGQMHGLDSYVSSCEHVTWLCKTLSR